MFFIAHLYCIMCVIAFSKTMSRGLMSIFNCCFFGIIIFSTLHVFMKCYAYLVLWF